MYIVLLVASLILVLASVSDIRHGEVPHTLTIIYLLLGILFVICGRSKSQAILSLSLFFIIGAIQVVVAFILKEGAIGGADIKMLTIGMLYVRDIDDLLYVFFAYAFFSGVAFVITKFVKKQKECRMLPYISLSLTMGLWWHYNYNFDTSIIMTVIMTSLIFTCDSIYYLWKGWKEDVQKIEKHFKR